MKIKSVLTSGRSRFLGSNLATSGGRTTCLNRSINSKRKFRRTKSSKWRNKVRNDGKLRVSTCTHRCRRSTSQSTGSDPFQRQVRTRKLELGFLFCFGCTICEEKEKKKSQGWEPRNLIQMKTRVKEGNGSNLRDWYERVEIFENREWYYKGKLGKRQK